jgi:hypothetical protein
MRFAGEPKPTKYEPKHAPKPVIPRHYPKGKV